MEFVPYDFNKYEGMSYKQTANWGFIEKFKKSGEKCAEVTRYPHKSASGCVNALNQTIKTYHIVGVKASLRKGKVFLIRTKEI